MGETRPGPADPLQDVTAEVERFVAAAGWDQPPRVFALVDSSQLPAEAPVTVEALAAVEHPAPPDGPLEISLRRIAWPGAVRGCAVVHETLLPPPPGLDDTRPADLEATGYAAARSDLRAARLAVAVLRDGSRAAVVRLRDVADPEARVLIAPDVAPELTEALLASLQ